MISDWLKDAQSSAILILISDEIKVDAKLEKLPKPIKSSITFISSITLEIYLIQIY